MPSSGVGLRVAPVGVKAGLEGAGGAGQVMALSAPLGRVSGCRLKRRRRRGRGGSSSGSVLRLGDG